MSSKNKNHRNIVVQSIVVAHYYILNEGKIINEKTYIFNNYRIYTII